ncbi:MAG: DUF1080 domain-containing protein [Calditrichaeota bacterium]|nr:MAG: DUF1080 domain-containing protein [Calditrichota bacterium]
MIKKIMQIMLVALLFTNVSAGAQSSKQAGVELQKLLKALPAQSPLVGEMIFEKIAQESENTRILCNLLYSNPQDTLLQYAINGLAKYVSKSGRKGQRTSFNKSVSEVLASNANRNIAATVFLLHQLKLTATDKILGKLKPLLQEDRFVDPAIEVVVNIGNANAGKTLHAALKSASEKQKLSLINALGELGFRPAEKSLLKLVQGKNVPVADAAMLALSEFSSPSVIEQAIAINANKEKKGKIENNLFRLKTARRMLAQGDKKSAVVVRDQIDENTLSPHSYIQYLEIFYSIDPVTGFQKCLAAARNENSRIAVAAVKLASQNSNNDAVKKWIAVFSEINETAQPQVISLIAGAASPLSVEFLKQQLQSENQQHRIAAIQSLELCAKENTVAFLTEHLASVQNNDEIAAVFAVFSTQPLEGVASQLIEQKTNFQDEHLLATLQFLRQKNYSGDEKDFTNLFDHENPRIRIATVDMLREFASSALIPILFKKAQSAENEREKKEIFTALKEISTRANLADSLIDESLERLGTSTQIDDISFELQLLARLGDKKAIVPINELTKNGDAEIADAAHRALFDWSETHALESILPIAENTENETYHILGLRAIKRLIDGADFIAEAKVHYIQRALAISRTDEGKRLLLGSLSQVHSQDALRLALHYLNDDSLKVAAGVTAVQIALDDERWRNDDPTAQILHAVLKNSLDASSFTTVQNSFEQRNETPRGFEPLFNGNDLAGWRGLAADPVKRQKMTDEEYAAAQVRADSIMHAHWWAEDGLLYFDGLGQSLCTAKDYENYELRLEWKIEEDGDSGIYLRGAPQVQIWDPALNKGVGSGGLFNNKIGADKPLNLADRPIGEWNSFRITLIDDRCTVYLNDVLVVDDVALENYWQRDKKLYSTGSIELQAHNSPLVFRNLFIRELPATIDTSTVTLFNGSDLTGWDVVGSSEDSWFVKDAKLTTSAAGGGWISTQKEYADFRLELEFRVPAGGNSGVFIRAPRDGNPAYEGMEIQVLDDYADKYKTLKMWQYTGSIYAVQAPKLRVTKKAGEWQKMIITCKGPAVKVDLNGENIIDTNLIDHMDKSGSNPGLKRRKGYIGFQNHGAPVEYRNVRIREY